MTWEPDALATLFVPPTFRSRKIGATGCKSFCNATNAWSVLLSIELEVPAGIAAEPVELVVSNPCKAPTTSFAYEEFVVLPEAAPEPLREFHAPETRFERVPPSVFVPAVAVFVADMNSLNAANMGKVWSTEVRNCCNWLANWSTE